MMNFFMVVFLPPPAALVSCRYLFRHLGRWVFLAACHVESGHQQHAGKKCCNDGVFQVLHLRAQGALAGTAALTGAGAGALDLAAASRLS